MHRLDPNISDNSIILEAVKRCAEIAKEKVNPLFDAGYAAGVSDEAYRIYSKICDEFDLRREGIRWEVHAEPTKGAGEGGRRGTNQDPGYIRQQGQAQALAGRPAGD